MFEDSLIESGGRLKNEARRDDLFVIWFADRTGRSAGIDSADVHRSVAQNSS